MILQNFQQIYGLIYKLIYMKLLIRLKGEIERLEVEYNENISKEQAKYNLDTNKLKDQIFENEVIQKSLEKEVSFVFLNLLFMH